MKTQESYDVRNKSDKTALGIELVLRYIFEELPESRKYLDHNIVNLETHSKFEKFSKLCKEAESHNPILNKLVDYFFESIKKEENYIDHYITITKETLHQDQVNWGRIVTFISFTKILIKKSIQKERLDIAKKVINELPTLIENHTENEWKYFDSTINNHNDFTSTLKLIWNFTSNSLW